ncbi:MULTISPECIES: phage major tail tube protein [unclassified Acidocella]|uniref:phage major tail tube protein n=1 Tax=unclassified Acidocella TaxID=2648610 RepID=UPI00028C2F4C|nr:MULTISPECIES: phage major tail tube protein [unclassified Acidocella]EKN00981.1 hypothetical protein MXAZACID_02450 [Acidocella sp. MX-AZ02]WBO60538.1 phage major tail tube protein [Acidocella sp. MX-AZ03]
MAASDIRKNFNLFVSGKGYAGQVTEVNAPKLTQQTEDFRGGGMEAPVELTMGMEKLMMDFTMVSYDPNVLGSFGITEGAAVPFIIREVLESYDGTVTPVVHTIRGKIKEIDPGTSKPGRVAELKVQVSASYYKLQHGTSVIHEIDVLNMIQVINGKDVLSAMRSALGM